MTLEEQLFSLMDRYGLKSISISAYAFSTGTRCIDVTFYDGELSSYGRSEDAPSAKDAVNAAVTALEAKRLKLAPVTDVPAIEGLAA